MLIFLHHQFPFVFRLIFFFFNDTATTEIYTLSLHDALPICNAGTLTCRGCAGDGECGGATDRKSTRLNSSHMSISYAVFCLKKKNKTQHYGPHAEIEILNRGDIELTIRT